jgi:hypothetical protein
MGGQPAHNEATNKSYKNKPNPQLGPQLTVGLLCGGIRNVATGLVGSYVMCFATHIALKRVDPVTQVRS